MKFRGELPTARRARRSCPFNIELGERGASKCCLTIWRASSDEVCFALAFIFTKKFGTSHALSHAMRVCFRWAGIALKFQHARSHLGVGMTFIPSSVFPDHVLHFDQLQRMMMRTLHKSQIKLKLARAMLVAIGRGA